MQIERLFQMVFYIISHEHVTAKDLANYFNVSTRTIYRDINTLSIAGVPIISTKGSGGGISLIDGYTIDKSMFSKEEQQNIYQGLQILQATDYPNSDNVLNKIDTIFGKNSKSKWIDVDFSYWGSYENQKVNISELQYSIVNKHKIKFSYYNTELKKSVRVVEPLQLLFKSRTWYIVGFCTSREEIRIFRLSRMKEIEILSEKFFRELPADFTLETTMADNCDHPIFKLKFSPEIAYRLFDDFQESQISKCDDGSFIVTFQLELSQWTFNYLLSFGKYVEILEPKIARKMLKEKALEIVKKYN